MQFLTQKVRTPPAIAARSRRCPIERGVTKASECNKMEYQKGVLSLC